MKKKSFFTTLITGGIDSSREGWGSQVYPVDISRYNDSEKTDVQKKKDMTAKLAWMEAGSFYGYTKSIRETLQTNYAKGKSITVDVTFARYLLDGQFVWQFMYHHKTKTVDPTPWYKWYSLPEKERDDWYPTVRCGVKGDDGAKDLLDMVKTWDNDRDFVKVFAEAFWEMAGVWLGMKLDKDKETVQLKVPKHNHGKMPNFTIGIEGKSVYLRAGFNLSAKEIEELSEEERDEFMVAVQKFYKEFTTVLKGVGRNGLAVEDEETGPKKTDFDYLKEAFTWVQENVAGVRDKYAEDGIAMVENNQKRKKSIDVIIANMELTGDYEDVLTRYEEIKKDPKKADETGDDEGKDKKDKSEPKTSGHVKAYRQQEKKYGDKATRMTPAMWANGPFASCLWFKEARDPGQPLAGLEYTKYSIFEIAIEYASNNGGKAIPKELASACDAERRRIEKESDDE